MIRMCSYFWSADKDGDGKLSRAEFGNMVRNLQLDMDEHHIDKAFQKSDKDDTDSISFSEFAASFLNRKSRHALSHGCVKQTFRSLDTRGRDYLSVKDTMKALQLLGCDLEEPHIEKILWNIDPNHDGKITLKEFCVFLDIGDE